MVTFAEFEAALQTENHEDAIFQRLKHYYDVILPFYQHQCERSYFVGHGGLQLARCIHRHPNPRAKVVIVSGYNESFLKYAETIKDLADWGLSVYAYDHRGQGFSDHFPGQRKRGWFDSFESLTDDLQAFYTCVQNDGDTTLPVAILAHSLGALVTLHALYSPKPMVRPQALVLHAPLLQLRLNVPEILDPLAKIFVRTLCGLNMGLRFIPGQHDCIPFLPFETNEVTHSKYRFVRWRRHIAEIEAIQQGGATCDWVKGIIAATDALPILMKKQQNPLSRMLVLQAAEDDVVRNSGWDKLAAYQPHAVVHVCPFARHEILSEVDVVRSQALGLIRRMIDEMPRR